MSLAYRLLYGVGFTPWEQVAALPVVTEQISALFDREGSGFGLLLDFGLFHDELTDQQRAAMGREVSAVAVPGATLLLRAWAPGRRGPLPRGASREDIEAAYPEWTVIDEAAFDVTGASFYKRMRKADPGFNRLRRD